MSTCLTSQTVIGRGWRSRFGALCAGGFVTLMCVSCLDAPTAPSRESAANAPVAHADLLPSSVPNVDTVTIIQTIDVAGRGGHPGDHREKTIRHVSRVMAYKPHEDRPRPAALDTTKGVDDVPVSGLSVAASSRSVGRTASEGQPWVQSHTYGDSGAGVVESEGHGDAPASEIRLVQNGEVVFRILQTWQRGEYTWDLVRRETVVPDGSFHEVLQIHHSGVVPRPGRPRVGLSGAFSVRPVKSNASLDINFFNQGGISVLTFDPCEGDNYDDPGACAAEHEAANDAAADVIVAEVTATAVCAAAVAGGPVGAIACVAALGTVAFLIHRSEKKTQAWTDCVARYHTSCGCDGETSVGSPRIGGGSSGMPVSKSPGGVHAADACTDFAFDDDSDTGNAGGDDFGSDDETETCYYWVAWDDSGDIVDVELLYCEADE
jgi:hypothetical protein